MNKIQGQNESFFNRSGSFATHASRTGVNLLGWGEDEVLTDQQRREALAAAKQPLIEAIRVVNAQLKAKLNYKEFTEKQALQADLKAKIHYVDTELYTLNKILNRYRSGNDMGDFVIKVAQSKMTRHQWALVMAEARSLYEAALKEVA